MRSLKEIYNEIQVQATKDWCQSTNSITIVAMERAILEYKEEIIEELHNISDAYEVLNGVDYFIRKTDLDMFINKLEQGV